ncbi:HPr family phosphocarrier protein [uncultured Rhodoblastus sp.]|uniref:HPr family phosphocarrier protein n=1 Tax=uncultured Rhodoblastus sp. TaxID=543037 RepID=UPI0025EB577A|nr:HPr family phosphocarrier protein [uncultured Rhodoblastus sp.]
MSEPEPVEPNDRTPNALAPEGSVLREIEIVNRKGLHARATAKLVHCVEQFDADVTVSRGGETVGGESIMGILTLGAGIGSTISVAASGPQAQEAIDAIVALIGSRFGEDE